MKDNKSFLSSASLISALTSVGTPFSSRIQQASAKLRNVFVKALLWC